MAGEIQPMVGVENRSNKVEKQNRTRHTRLGITAKEAYSEENAPKEAKHHRQRYNPLVQHILALCGGVHSKGVRQFVQTAESVPGDCLFGGKAVDGDVINEDDGAVLSVNRFVHRTEDLRFGFGHVHFL